MYASKKGIGDLKTEEFHAYYIAEIKVCIKHIQKPSIKILLIKSEHTCLPRMIYALGIICMRIIHTPIYTQDPALIRLRSI